MQHRQPSGAADARAARFEPARDGTGAATARVGSAA